MFKKEDYPKYYDVDDIPVRVDFDEETKGLKAVNWNGSARRPYTVSHDGNEISKETYDQAVLNYQKYYLEKSISEKEFKMKISELFGTQFPDLK